MICIEKLDMRRQTESSARKRRFGLYKCLCGSTFEMLFIDRSGQSCAYCKPGVHERQRLNITWQSMRQRCNDKNHKGYKYYGGRGISVCAEWNDYLEFKYWSASNGYKEHLTIDRINNDGNYTPENCRWVDRCTQSQNSRRLKSSNSSGYRGSSKNGKSFKAEVTANGATITLGHYKTAKDAAIVRDLYVLDNGLEHTLNFSLKELKDLKQKPKPQRVRNSTSYRGVHAARKNYKALLYSNGSSVNLGTFRTAIEGAIVRDLHIIEHNLGNALNFTAKELKEFTIKHSPQRLQYAKKRGGKA